MSTEGEGGVNDDDAMRSAARRWLKLARQLQFLTAIRDALARDVDCTLGSWLCLDEVLAALTMEQLRGGKVSLC